MNTTTLVASPHAHAPVSIGRTMGLVLLALLPAALFGLYQFGWPAIWLLLVTTAAALLFEGAALAMAGKPVRPALMDGSGLLTGVLVAMTLPPWAPWWVGVIGAFIAIVVGKQVFGGLGQNLFNPAMVARVTLLISFPVEMTRFLYPRPLFSVDAPGPVDGLAITFLGRLPDGLTFDAISGASLLSRVRTDLAQGLSLSEILPDVLDPVQAMLGQIPGSLGETSAALLATGGLFLIAKRVIGWQVPAAILGTIAAMATLMSLLDPDHYPGAVYHLLTGSTMLCAFFIATDPVTSPVSVRGQVLFGVACGFLIYAIRTWGGYPEGVGFAVLLMNACTPMIDHYLRPRVYGRTRSGEPLPVPADATAGKEQAR